MTNKELLQKIRDEIERRRLHFNKEAEKYQALNNGYSQNCYGARDALRDLENFLDTLQVDEPEECLLTSKSQKIKGWVARDDDGSLWLYASKPKRACYTEGKTYFEEDLEEGMTPWIWAAKEGETFEIPDRLFPDLKWEDEPINVIINAIKVDEPKRNVI